MVTMRFVATEDIYWAIHIHTSKTRQPKHSQPITKALAALFAIFIASADNFIIPS